jgi:radical SAM superfamily enzyme YgiQ (UPF0313 family)
LTLAALAAPINDMLLKNRKDLIRMATLEGTVYRPPLEAGSVLLEIALGCSYGKCSFCQYANGETPLQLIPSEVLADNLEEMAVQNIRGSRMFLLGGNVLAFKTRYLTDIFHFAQSYLPEITQFSMYARADDVMHKTDEQLSALRDAGLRTVYIGVESGSARILRSCRKGETPEEIVAALHRLDHIGIQYGLSSILGLGGEALWRENALETAALYSEVHPLSVRVMTLTPMPGTPLAASVADGSFRLEPPRTSLEEELLLLENMRCGADSPCRFVGSHGSNSVAVAGNLPADREKLTGILRNAIRTLSDQELVKSPPSQW